MASVTLGPSKHCLPLAQQPKLPVHSGHSPSLACSRCSMHAERHQGLTKGAMPPPRTDCPRKQLAGDPCLRPPHPILDKTTLGRHRQIWVQMSPLS